jgi:hypothetical protein
MSLQGCIYVEAELETLSKIIAKNSHLPPERQIEIIKKWIADTILSAKGGWL